MYRLDPSGASVQEDPLASRPGGEVAESAHHGEDRQGQYQRRERPHGLHGFTFQPNLITRPLRTWI